VTDLDTSLPAPKRGRIGPLLWFLLALLVCLLGFTFSSSLASAVSVNRWWMLGVGACSALLIPAVLAGWVRSMRRGRGSERRSAAPGEPAPPPPRVVRQPSTSTGVLLVNLILLASGVLLAQQPTQTTVRAHGSWWVAHLVTLIGGAPDNVLIRGADGALKGLADLLPGAEAARKAPPARDALGAGDGGAGSRAPDGGAATPRADAATTTRGADAAHQPPPGGAVKLKYEKQGTGIVVPVTLYGPSGAVQVKMLFDTGASITTLDSATLRRLGLSLTLEDPTIETSTANGTVRRKITVIDGAAIKGARVSGVAVSHCEPCAVREVVGLLGLNVQRQFKVTLDDEASELTLEPRPRRSGHLLDIRPFVKLTQIRGSWRGPQLSVRLQLHNQSRRTMRYLKLAAVVKRGGKTGQIWGEVRDVPPRAKIPVKLEGLSSLRGERFTLELERADW
jgi:Aspartyl protease